MVYSTNEATQIHTIARYFARRVRRARGAPLGGRAAGGLAVAD